MQAILHPIRSKVWDCSGSGLQTYSMGMEHVQKKGVKFSHTKNMDFESGWGNCEVNVEQFTRLLPIAKSLQIFR